MCLSIHHYCIILDVDSVLLSSAILLLTGATAEETLAVLSPQGFSVQPQGAGVLRVTPSGGMAPIAEFQEVLRSVAYSTTRQM